MGWKICIIIIAGLVTGCTTICKPFCEPTTIVTPVPCPKPVISARTALPIAGLKETDTPDTVLKAYVLSVKMLVGRVCELETVLNGYR